MRRAGVGSIPSSRRKSSVQASTWRVAPPRSPAARRQRTSRTCAFSSKGLSRTSSEAWRGRVGGLAAREQRERGLMKHGARRPGDVTALALEPHLEAGAGAEGQAVEQLVAEPGQRDRLHPRAPAEHVDVDERARAAASGAAGSPPSSASVAELAAQRRRASSGAPRSGSSASGKSRPGQRARARAGTRLRTQVGEQPPGLVAARRVHRPRRRVPSAAAPGGGCSAQRSASARHTRRHTVHCDRPAVRDQPAAATAPERTAAERTCGGCDPCRTGRSRSRSRRRARPRRRRRCTSRPGRAAQKIDEIAGNSSELNTPFLDGCPIQSPGRARACTWPRTVRAATGCSTSGSRAATAPDAPFGAPENLGEPVNSAGRRLLPDAGSRRRPVLREPRGRPPASCGLGDIYFTRRNPVRGWSGAGAPRAARPTGPNSALDEQGPSYVEAGGRRAVLLAQLRDRPRRHLRQPRAARRRASARPRRSPSSTTRTANDIQPNVRKDGREIVFSSNRTDPAGKGGQDIYVATRGDRNAPWSAPVNAGGGVNTAAAETRPSLSWHADGCSSAARRARRASPTSTSPRASAEPARRGPQALREELERLAGLGLLLAADVDALARRGTRASRRQPWNVSAGSALGRELDEPGVVGVQPHLGDEPARRAPSGRT